MAQNESPVNDLPMFVHWDSEFTGSFAYEVLTNPKTDTVYWYSGTADRRTTSWRGTTPANPQMPKIDVIIGIILDGWPCTVNAGFPIHLKRLRSLLFPSMPQQSSFIQVPASR